MTARTRRWPPIPLSLEERVAFATLRLLMASGLLDRWSEDRADRTADHEAGKHEDLEYYVVGCPLCEAEQEPE